MTTAEILAKIPEIKVLVIGDICLDRWCRYDPRLAEPSRETNLDRVAVVGTEVTPGAGGTVANNLAALGCRNVSVLGVVADDGHGYELRAALQSRGIDQSLLVNAPGATFTYTKLLNVHTEVEDLGRIDFLSFPPPPEAQEELIARLRSHAASYDCILVADQMETAAGGVVTAAVRSALCEIAATHRGTLVWIDSRMRIELFPGAVLKPNEREAGEACERLGLDRRDYRGLFQAAQASMLIVTHGGDGVTILRPDSETTIPTRKVENPVDICGAGDSFSAGACLALCAGASPEEASKFAHLVTSVTIMKPGTGTASPAEVVMAERMLGL
ncbi:MAG: ribokinase [Acidobacteria bacterium]|nr:ribokinase [Acidobacteriota bacterium]